MPDDPTNTIFSLGVASSGTSERRSRKPRQSDRAGELSTDCIQRFAVLFSLFIRNRQTRSSGQSEALPNSTGLAGQTLGPYTLISQFGQGGMGSVWLARRSDGRFERQAAVKFVSMALAGRATEERFKREGTILGRLTHPHIAELLDAGISWVEKLELSL